MASCEEYVASIPYWEDLCKKCNQMGEQISGFVEYLGTQFNFGTYRDVKELFLELDITKTHRVVVFIMWLQKRENPFEKYRRLVLEYPETWLYALTHLLIRS